MKYLDSSVFLYLFCLGAPTQTTKVIARGISPVHPYRVGALVHIQCVGMQMARGAFELTPCYRTERCTCTALTTRDTKEISP